VYAIKDILRRLSYKDLIVILTEGIYSLNELPTSVVAWIRFSIRG
jgi:hypothetical protein